MGDAISHNHRVVAHFLAKRFRELEVAEFERDKYKEALEYIAHELDDDRASARTMQRVAKVALGEDPDDTTPES